MHKKIVYLLALASFLYSAQNAGLAAQDPAGGVQWRATTHGYWDYLEQRQEVDEDSWNAFPAEEQKTMLAEAKRACAEAGKAVELLSASPLDGDRMLEVDAEGEADAKACYKQEGKLLSEKLRLLKGIKARGENGALTENDINWLEENDVSWLEKYKEAYRLQALKPRIGEDAAKRQKQLEKFNAEGTGSRLSDLSKSSKQGDPAALDKFFDGGTSRGQDADVPGGSLSLKPGTMKTAGKSPEDQRIELMRKGQPPPALGGKPGENPKFNKSLTDVKYQKIEGNLYSTGSGKTADIHTMAINQGQAGDCYFLASAAAIAKKDPDFIRNSIHENSDGTYSVDFYREKPWWKPWGPEYTKETITVDNQFPTRMGNPEFNNSKGVSETGKRENMWGMVYEKAYAKFKGSYDAIGDGGWPSTAMGEITGQPSSTYSTKAASLDKLTEWGKKGYALTAASKSKPSDLTVVGDHAYYVLNVDMEKKTVTLGNPWGFKNVTLTEEEFRKNYSEVYINPIKQKE